MKEEKEAERQVGKQNPVLRVHAFGYKSPRIKTGTLTFFIFAFAETRTGDQGQARSQGREGAIREDGCDDAPKACRAAKAQGEAQQAHQLVVGALSSLHVHA